MEYDELWNGGPKLEQSGDVFPLGTDSVLLADFALRKSPQKLCDLGCGSGVIAILLCWQNPGSSAECYEISAEAVAVAEHNIVINGLSDRIRIFNRDIRDIASLGEAGGFDLAVSNPPYFPVCSGAVSRDNGTARSEAECSLHDVCAAARRLVRWGGRLAIVHKPERLAEVFAEMSANGFEPKRLRLVQNTPESAPNLALIESRRGGKPGLVIEPPLILTGEDGESDEIRKIYHREGK